MIVARYEVPGNAQKKWPVPAGRLNPKSEFKIRRSASASPWRDRFSQTAQRSRNHEQEESTANGRE
jgi:hypothetical protein